jgi:stringent starvation protein B
MNPTAQDRRRLFEHLLANAPSVFVTLNATFDGVVVPPKLLHRTDLVLQFGMDMPVPLTHFRITDAGLSAVMSFGGSPFAVAVPWGAVYVLTGESSDEVFYFPESAGAVGKMLNEAIDRHLAEKPTLPYIDPIKDPLPSSNVISFADARERLRGRARGDGLNGPKRGA